MPSKTSIIIMGGGPAGTTAAILLQKNGFDVTLFEKEKHPRYHVGESGILSLPFILQLLDVEKDLIKLGAKRKGGVFFDWNQKWIINWSKNNDYTYHVDRAQFDYMLIQKAKSMGVKVFEETKIDEVLFDNEKPVGVKVNYQNSLKSFYAKYIIDATGRGAILARKYFKSQVPLDAFKNVALWGYWINYQDTQTLEGFKDIDGNSSDIEHPILISSIANGWIWGIPMPDKRLSLGVVLSQKYYDQIKSEKDKKEIYVEAIKQSESALSLLENASLISPIRITADWSYMTSKWAGENYFLVGDSAVFIDPLLSTGMTSAMLSSVMASACICEIEKGIVDPKKIYDFYGNDYQRRFWRLSFVIGSLYSAKGNKEDLFSSTHSLTSNDLNKCSLDDFKSSFSSVISGLEDIKELSLVKLQHIAAERLEKNFGKYIHILPNIPKIDKSEFEVCFEPLGLLNS